MPLILRRTRCCKCGGLVCASCCRAGSVTGACCYSLAALRKPQVTEFYCQWYAEDPEFGESRSAEAEFTMVGGPYEIVNVSGVCRATIQVDGTWRHWDYNSNDPITFDNASLVVFPGYGGTDPTQWPINYPSHPGGITKDWGPRGISVDGGSWGCDFADADGDTDFYAVSGYINPVLASALYQMTIADTQEEECEFDSPDCLCA